MERILIDKLLEWKNSVNRKPLILKGARQVGKTWMMKEFGRLYYEKTFYFNFDEEVRLAQIFAINKNPHRIFELLGTIKGEKILPDKHLVIFDEIQECSDALNSLKYINEESNEYHVIVAGSLLGSLLAEPKSYPVGKVNILDVYPMNFAEFLNAVDSNLCSYLKNTEPSEILEIQHYKLLEQYYYYLIVGGMPECVQSWVKEKNPSLVLQIQKELLQLYENDISKHHNKVNVGKILLVFRSLVSQLAKENEKFVYGCLKSGARARDFEDAIQWLVSSGLVIRIFDVAKPEHPLNAYEDFSSFKLFFFDIGLAKCCAGVNNQSIILNEDFQFKGPFTENYCIQQLINQVDCFPHYYSPVQNYEVDFLIQRNGMIIPIECKSGKSVASTSFKRYIREHTPKYAIRFSQLPYKKQDSFVNLPLYLACFCQKYFD